jgi:hypothetical protein
VRRLRFEAIPEQRLRLPKRKHRNSYNLGVAPKVPRKHDAWGRTP